MSILSTSAASLEKKSKKAVSVFADTKSKLQSVVEKANSQRAIIAQKKDHATHDFEVQVEFLRSEYDEQMTLLQNEEADLTAVAINATNQIQNIDKVIG